MSVLQVIFLNMHNQELRLWSLSPFNSNNEICPFSWNLSYLLCARYQKGLPDHIKS